MPSGIRPVKSAAHQPSRPTTQTTPVNAPASRSAGIGEPEPEERDQPPLRLRRVDREVDRVAAGGADEARERAADQEQEGADVHRVAHPGGDEAVQRPAARVR